MMTLNQRLDLIKSKILQDRFLESRGLANEINFWIFDYDAKDELAVRSHIEYLEQSINSEYTKVRIVKIDLFDVMVDILKEKGYLDKVIQMEKIKGSDKIIDPIKKTLRLTQVGDLIGARITESITSEKDIVFLTGVGKSWPVIRSHTVLNGLHSKIDSNPIIMFFPGNYENELKLFSEITDDNYYRAFKLIER